VRLLGRELRGKLLDDAVAQDVRHAEDVLHDVLVVLDAGRVVALELVRGFLGRGSIRAGPAADR
jgi:hypothetical protein